MGVRDSTVGVRDSTVGMAGFKDGGVAIVCKMAG